VTGDTSDEARDLTEGVANLDAGVDGVSTTAAASHNDTEAVQQHRNELQLIESANKITPVAKTTTSGD